MSHGRSDNPPSQSTGCQTALLQESEQTTIPEKSWSEWGIALLLFVTSCLYLRLFYNYASLAPDEGITLQGAQRVLQGQVLYRDFFSFLTPGTYYWTALLFKIFGSSILVARAALIVYGGVFSVFTYLLARRVCCRWVALFTVYLLVLICLPSYFVVLHNWDSTLWACLCLYAAIRFLESGLLGWAFAAGTLLSLTCLFEQSKGAGLLLGLAFGFGSILAIEGRKSGFTLEHLSSFCYGSAWPALLTALYFATQGALLDMVKDVLWPLLHYSTVNKVPYGWPNMPLPGVHKLLAGPWPSTLTVLAIISPYILIDTLPIIGLGFLGVCNLRLRGRKYPRGRAQYLVLVSGAIVGMLASTVAGRPDMYHVLFQAPIFILVLAWILDDACVRSPSIGKVRPILSLYLFLSFTLLGLSLLWRPLNAQVVLHTRRGDLKAEKSDPSLKQIQAYTSPGQWIFVHPFQPTYYYLTATSNPTKYEFLFPGMFTPGQFDAARKELIAGRPAIVLFCPSFLEVLPSFWPATPIEALAGKDPVADYILGHYRVCETLPSAVFALPSVIMVRKDLGCAKTY